MSDVGLISESALGTLKRLQQRRPAEERCELCALPLEKTHTHLLEVQTRRLICSCDPCAFLFQESGQRYVRVPREVFHLKNFCLEDFQWGSLSIPISLAFFFFSSMVNRMVAYYPSPAGAMESSLDLRSWQEIAACHTRLQQLTPDVQAFLVNRLASPPEYYVVPIDRCYELAGIVRKHWTGFSGGDAVWSAIDQFFSELQDSAIVNGNQTPSNGAEQL